MKEREKKGTLSSWTILWKYLSGYKREFVILSILGVFSALANGSVPYIAGKFFDAILAPDIAFPYTQFAMPLWAFLLIVWATVQSIAMVTDWRNSRTADMVSNQGYVDYVSRAYGYMLRLPLSYYKKSKQGGTHQAISRAANAIESISGRIIIDLTPKFFKYFYRYGICVFYECHPRVGAHCGCYVVYNHIGFHPTGREESSKKNAQCVYDRVE